MPDIIKSTDSLAGFKRHLAVTIILLNLLVYFLAGLTLYQSRVMYEKQAAVSTQNLASLLDHFIDGEIHSIDMALIAVKNEAEGQIARGGIGKEALNRYIDTLHSYLSQLQGLRMTNSRGDVICGTGSQIPGVSVNVADRDYFIFERDNPKGDIFISKPILGRIAKKWLFTIARRVNNPDGSFAGIVYGSITLDHFIKVFSGIDVGKNGSITLRSDELAVIVRYPEPNGVGSTVGNTNVVREFSDLIKAGKDNATFKARARLDGEERMFSYRKIASYPLYIVVGIAKNEYLAVWRNESLIHLGLVAVFTLITLFSSGLFLIGWKREQKIELELRKSKKELELRVGQRTADLNVVNEKLKTELAERKQAEEENSKLEEQLRHSQKMEAVGQLAGGIAHDFNNALTAIIGFSSLTEMKMAKDDPLRMNMGQILAAADRAASLTRSLLAFSRKQSLNPRPVNLCEIVRDMGKLLATLIGEDIQLQTDFRKAYLNIYADRGQIEQVLMNLAANSRDAMPTGGTLLLETTSVLIDENFLHFHGYGEPGRYALLTVSDSGSGFDTETTKRIFEPFFTTKEFGKGTGLGLSIVYGIIKQHNGYINVYSEPDKGTIFNIYLPLIEAEPTLEEKELLPYPEGGTETVLVAEDDPFTRSVETSILKEFGYTVIEAVDGEDAVKKFLEHQDVIQLLLFDMIMPNKNGKKAYEDIKCMCPSIPVLFFSGYTADFIDKKSLLEEGVEVLIKPVHPHVLARKMREALDKEGGRY